MNVTGIVAEYNPFHNGHLYQLKQTKLQTNSDFVIAIMSGNFSQRGTPCIADKFVRTQMALSCGIDMVIELPVPFATASAERFCEAAVSAFNKTGIVNTLSFGSEIGDIELLKEIAHCLIYESAFFSEKLQDYLSKGFSFPRAREKALIHLFTAANSTYTSLESVSEIVGNPNNILGIEYLKALIKYHSSITPLTIKREVAHYHDTHIHAPIASATAIRTQLNHSNQEAVKMCMPTESYRLLTANQNCIPELSFLNDFLHCKLIFSHKTDLYSLWDIPKDLITSIYNAFKENLSLSKIIDKVTSKTYTRATVQRAVFRIILGIQINAMEQLKAVEWIPYLRVLGCKKEATKLLSALTNYSSVPVITNLKPSHPELSKEAALLIDYELKASNIYHHILQSPQGYYQDFKQSFIKF